MTTLDPILAALDAANAAEAAHLLACENLDESDVAAMRGCNAACDGAALARASVMQTMPTTVGGLRALACHYARWGETFAEGGFLHIATALSRCDPTIPLSGDERTP